MGLVSGYGLAVLWMIAFLAFAWFTHRLFERVTPFPLRQASDQKNAAVGHVLRGLYVSLAIILYAAIRSNQSIVWGAIDGFIGVLLLVATYKVFDWLDPRDFGAELAAGNTLLGMELEGVFILAAALVVGSLNLLGS
jgi:uncharacterized membrane protein YjfL (UPF0719 family)